MECFALWWQPAVQCLSFIVVYSCNIFNGTYCFIKYSRLLLCPIICLSLATTRVKLSTSRGREKRPVPPSPKARNTVRDSSFVTLCAYKWLFREKCAARSLSNNAGYHAHEIPPKSYCENLNRNRYAIYFRESETAGERPPQWSMSTHSSDGRLS